MTEICSLLRNPSLWQWPAAELPGPGASEEDFSLQFELPGVIPSPVSGVSPPPLIIPFLPLWRQSFFQSFLKAFWECVGEASGAFIDQILTLLGTLFSSFFCNFSGFYGKVKIVLPQKREPHF